MNELSGWFAGQARREARIVYLEEALLGNRFWRYSAYRLRYFVACYAVASATHVVTVILLYRFFDSRDFAIVLVVYAAAAVVTNFWWGSLEAMRAEVRRLYRQRLPHLIPKAVGRWLSFSLQVALVVALGTCLWVAEGLLAGGSFGPAELYVTAILLQLGTQFFTRTYHSGIYAIRRVYRPLPAILGVELFGVTAAIVLTPWLGAWALPVGALLGVPVVAGLSIYFTHRAYGFLGLSPLGHVHVWRPCLPRRAALRDFLGGGLSYALIGIDSLLVIVLFTAERDVVSKTGLFALFFLLAPTVRAGTEWAQLFYFDLKRLEISPFRMLRRRFERAVHRLAVVLGLALSAVAVLIGALVSHTSIRDLVLVLVAFFVSASLLAVVQIQAYAARAYTALIANALLVLIGFGAVAWWVDSERATVLMLAGVALAGYLQLALRRERTVADAGQGLLWPMEWLAQLRAIDRPVRVAAARFCDEGAPEDAAWRHRQVGVLAARRLRHGGKATLIEPGVLVWFERVDGRAAVEDPSALAVGGGLLEPLGSRSGETGLAALHAAARAGLVGRELAAVTARPFKAPDPVQLRAAFARLFQGGIVYAPDEEIPALLAALPADDKRAAVADALAYSRDLRPRRPSSNFHVTALCEAGGLRLVFLVSRRAPRRLRERWETLITRHNLQAVLALQDAEVG